MVIEVRIDYEKCLGCKNCIRSCTFGVLEWLDEGPIVVDPHSCHGCRECERNCPTQAIEIVEK
ncbi:4Fe-4S binding protein [Candidatus Bathyarchaeota archaeon]|nr:4Fe-4S binding protein [Candidatus Bathyarchaeota archaeon]